MRKTRQIYGLILRPSELNQEDYEKRIFSSDYAIKSDFRKEYSDHLAAMQINALAAKIYIINNWQKIKDWTDLDISIIDNSKEETHYYNYKEKKGMGYRGKSEKVLAIFERFEQKEKDGHNPVVTLSDVVLDPTDGDFSLTINGKDHNWIDDDSVIILADFIENKLKEE